MFLESIDLYAKNWSKREQVELKCLSEWKDQLKKLVADRISNLKGHFKSDKSGCPATWKTWKCQGISMQGEKVREFVKNKKSQGILFCEIHFQPI